jgi:hypothetical protein
MKPVVNPSPPKSDGPEHQLSAIEKLLSDTADFFEKALHNRPEAQEELRTLLNNKRHPNVQRVLQADPSGRLSIVVSGQIG